MGLSVSLKNTGKGTGGEGMYLTKSQLYFIRKAKKRKTFVIVAAIGRVMKTDTPAVTKRIVKNRISKELRRQFKVVRVDDIQEKDFERALDIVKKFKLIYCGQEFG